MHRMMHIKKETQLSIPILVITCNLPRSAKALTLPNKVQVIFLSVDIFFFKTGHTLKLDIF